MSVQTRAAELLGYASNLSTVDDEDWPILLTIFAVNTAAIEAKMDEVLDKMDEIITAIEGISLVVPP